jgi:hypothetical protein
VPVGGPPWGLLLADLDENGYLDVIYTLFLSRSIAVLYGGPAGTPPTVREFAVGERPKEMEVADLDGDGHLDVVVINYRSDTLSILLGDGRGDLVEVQQTGVRQEARSVAAADFDEDGRPDLAVANGVTDDLYVIFNETDVELDCRGGNVNAGVGDPVDVLFVNGSPGTGNDRRVELEPDAPFEIGVDAPPFREDGPVRFAIYLWTDWPTGSTVEILSARAGRICMSTPIHGGYPGSFHRWITIRHRDHLLGEPTLPSAPAPTFVYRGTAEDFGVPRLFLQGIIVDPNSPSGIAAVTNGVAVEVR